MAKVQIKLPDNAYQCRRRVLYGDTDSGGVVYYANYLRYFEQGRTELMRDMGCTYRDLEDQGFILPVVESYCRYKASALYDDLLTIHTALVDLQKVSCRFHYAISKESDPRPLVKGYTVHAVVSRTGRLVKFPPVTYEMLSKICLTDCLP